MPSTVSEWLFWAIPWIFSGIGVPSLTYFFPPLRRIVLSTLQRKNTTNELLENILDDIEAKVYGGQDSAVLTLEVIANSLEASKGVVTIEAQITVDALIKRLKEKWAKDLSAHELPGYAVDAIGEISIKHNIDSGKDYIKSLFEEGGSSNYANNKHFWACASTRYAEIKPES